MQNPTVSHLIAAVLCLLLHFAGRWSQADEPPPASPDFSGFDFQADVLPILRTHCVRCHGPDTQEARVRLDNLSTDLIRNRAAAETWHEVLNVLNAAEMPPEDEPGLPEAQRQTLTGWVSGALDQAVAARRKTDGRGALRRLNRVEYQNTMSDLLGLEMDYAKELPPDPASSDGFRNNGQALQMSSLQLEYYLKTARQALDRVIVAGPAPKVHDYTFSKSNVKGWRGNVERSNRLGRQQVFLGTMPKEYPEEGAFRIRVTLTADIKPDMDFPLLEVSLGYRPDTKVLFRTVATREIQSADEQVLEFHGRVENHPLPVRGQGKFPGLVVRLRNVYDDGSALPKKKGKAFVAEPHLPSLNIQSVEFTASDYEQWPPKLHRRILFESELADSEDPVYIYEVLDRFMARAFRRPPEAAEVQAMADFFHLIRPEFPTFEEAIRETLAMVLIRPDFLYLVEPSGDTKRPLNAWELASRLSYFLWSTMPDERLMELARQSEQKKLSDHGVLRSEVDRMLGDPRSDQFIHQFTEQWLHLEVVDRVAISADYHPNFDDGLKADMKGETRAFFAMLLRENKSALNLLDSDFACVNGPMARHYGIADVRGREFRQVPLKPEDRRGGLLGHASILLSNSTGSDSHAVRRAVWIRDRLLNDPPAPPPPNVPSLEEADAKFHQLSIRQQLEIHREAKACAQCHRDIDPWGIALEYYDAVGHWRDVVRRKQGKKFEQLAVQATDKLPDGTPLEGAEGLRAYLREEKRDQFAQAFVHRLLTYAIGRRLEISDRDEIASLTKTFTDNGYQIRALIHAIVNSPTFQSK